MPILGLACGVLALLISVALWIGGHGSFITLLTATLGLIGIALNLSAWLRS